MREARVAVEDLELVHGQLYAARHVHCALLDRNIPMTGDCDAC